MTYTITKNPTFGSVEISFSEKPAAAVRDALKALRFRWHKKNSVWYGYTSEEAARAAVAGAMDGTATEDAPAETNASSAAQPPKTNKYGVQVGAVFSASWGYEQTNVDFFQVVELVGSASVRVREISPEIVRETSSGCMSAERVYKIERKILQPRPSSVFIKDQQRGDVKRLKSYAADGVSNPVFKLDTFADARLCEPGERSFFESWYG